MIDWKSRIRNKYFIAGAISFFLLTIKTFSDYKFPENTNDMVNALLAALTGLGVLVDGSTPGLSDAPKVAIPIENIETSVTETSTTGEG